VILSWAVVHVAAFDGAWFGGEVLLGEVVTCVVVGVASVAGGRATVVEDDGAPVEVVVG